MAFVPVYGLNTAITAATAAGAGQLKVDNSVANSIDVELAGGFTYASLSDGVNYEIVRIDSVTAPFLNVTRGQDGITTSAFPAGACIRFVWNSEGISAIAAGVTFTMVGTGAATVSGSYPNFTINVDVPEITATLPIEVMGEYPAWEIGFQGSYGGCCCGSGGGGSGGTITEITGSGLVTVTGGTGPTANISVPVFNPIAGANMTITGSWPNITFASSGGGGGGGVASVTGSTKIAITGSMVNPVVNLVATGVGSHSPYNGLTFDNWGCLTGVNLAYTPIVNVISATPSTLSATVVADTVTLAFTGPLGSIAQISSSYTPDLSANYTNALASTVTTPAILSGQTLVITASAEAFDSATPTLPPVWGIGIFNGVSLYQGILPIPTGSHSMQISVVGPAASVSLSLKTTALTGTTSVVAQSLGFFVLTN